MLKSFYGLKQDNDIETINRKLTFTLLSFGNSQSKYDYFRFVKVANIQLTVLLLHQS